MTRDWDADHEQSTPGFDKHSVEVLSGYGASSVAQQCAGKVKSTIGCSISMNRCGTCFCALESSLAPWGVRGAPTLHSPLHPWRMHTRGNSVSLLRNTQHHWKVTSHAVRASSAVTDQELTERQRDIQLQMQRCHSMNKLQGLIRAGLQDFDARLASTAVRLGIVKSAVLLLQRPPQRESLPCSTLSSLLSLFSIGACHMNQV